MTAAARVHLDLTVIVRVEGDMDADELVDALDADLEPVKRAVAIMINCAPVVAGETNAVSGADGIGLARVERITSARVTGIAYRPVAIVEAGLRA